MLIYSFHMPLFMTISGYLFAFSSKRKDLMQTIKVKSRQLFLPLAYWTFIIVFFSLYKELLSGDLAHGAIYFLKYYISLLPYYLWFLWALFVISILTSLIAGKLNDKVILHILIFILLLSLTDRFGLMYIKFMYPFFLLGYFYNLHREMFKTYKKPIIYLSFIIFPVLLFFWSKQDLIYQSGMSPYRPDVLKVAIISLYRYVIGFTGIVVIITILKKTLYFPKVKFIIKMGTLSLGIYILQTIIFSVIDLFVPRPAVDDYIYTFVYTPIASLIIIMIGMLFTSIISKIPFIGKALFGGRY